MSLKEIVALKSAYNPGCGLSLEEWLAEQVISLREENALLKEELGFLASLDTLVAKWHKAHNAKPNDLPSFNEIDKIEERILNMCLSERKNK